MTRMPARTSGSLVVNRPAARAPAGIVACEVRSPEPTSSVRAARRVGRIKVKSMESMLDHEEIQNVFLYRPIPAAEDPPPVWRPDPGSPPGAAGFPQRLSWELSRQSWRWTVF